jgi:hypothetical protein
MPPPVSLDACVLESSGKPSRQASALLARRSRVPMRYGRMAFTNAPVAWLNIKPPCQPRRVRS